MLDAQTLSTIAYLQGQVEDLQRQKVLVEAQLVEAVAEKAQLASQINLLKGAIEDRSSGVFQELQLLRATYAELKVQHEQCLASSHRLSQQQTAAMQRCQQLERSLKSAELDNTDLSARVSEMKRSMEASSKKVSVLNADLQRLQDFILTTACGKPPVDGLKHDSSDQLPGNHSADKLPASFDSASNHLSDSHSQPDDPSSPNADTPTRTPTAASSPAETFSRLQSVMVALVGPQITTSLVAGDHVDRTDILKALQENSARLQQALNPDASGKDAAQDGAGGADGTGRTVFVTKLARHVTDDMLGRVFSAFGPVERSEMARRGHGSANRNFAWVRFARADDAEAALKFFGSGEQHAARFGELLGRSSGERVVVKRTQRELGPHGGIEPPSTSSAPSAHHPAPTSNGHHAPPSYAATSYMSNAFNTLSTPAILLPPAAQASIPIDPTLFQSMGRGYDGYMMSLAEGTAWPASSLAALSALPRTTHAPFTSAGSAALLTPLSSLTVGLPPTMQSTPMSVAAKLSLLSQDGAAHWPMTSSALPATVAMRAPPGAPMPLSSHLAPTPILSAALPSHIPISTTPNHLLPHFAQKMHMPPTIPPASAGMGAASLLSMQRQQQGQAPGCDPWGLGPMLDLGGPIVSQGIAAMQLQGGPAISGP